MSRYTHVIFDFGGVITASPFEAFNRLEEERGLPRDFVRRVNAAVAPVVVANVMLTELFIQ